MNDEYYNSPEYKAKMKQWMKEAEEEQEAENVAKALVTKSSNPDYVEKRLEQINEVIRHHSEETIKQKWPDLHKERAAFLQSAGEADPWIFLQQLGFKVQYLPSGNVASLEYEGKKLQFSTGFFQPGKLTIRNIHDPQRETNVEEKHFSIPQSIDQVYDLLDQFRPPIHMGAKSRAQYEANYVKSLKSKSK